MLRYEQALTIAVLVYCCGEVVFVVIVLSLVILKILCILPDIYWKLNLQLFQAELVELCLVGIELATSTSITGDVTTYPTMNLTYITYITYK